MKETSLLMHDSSEKDGKIETMLDYVLSWTLRRASCEYCNEKPILYGYCRAILFKLLGVVNYDHIVVKSVETWKQWERIDLHANIELSVDGNIEWHAILIENKGYSNTHDGQLGRYKDIFCKAYSTSPIKWILHYILLTCHEEDSRLEMYKKDCTDHKYSLFSVADLIDTMSEESESDIFNEFWGA